MPGPLRKEKGLQFVATDLTKKVMNLFMELLAYATVVPFREELSCHWRRAQQRIQQQHQQIATPATHL